MPLSALKVRRSRRGGRGVFAGVAFSAGDVVEEAPVLVIPPDQYRLLSQTVLGSYLYTFGPDGDGDNSAIALGYGSLYNHSYRPNAAFIKLWKARTIRFVAVRAIRAGEEITIDYEGSTAQYPIPFKSVE